LSLLTTLALLAVGQLAAQRAPFPFPPTDVMLLGTFHFADAGLDDSRPDRQIALESTRDSVEIEELLRRLDAWRPTRIAVEWPEADQTALDSAYRSYRDGTAKPTANERSSVGFALATRLGHARVYAVDAPARWYDSTVNTAVLERTARAHGQEELIGRAGRWFAWFEMPAADTSKDRRTLLQTLIGINQPENLRGLHSRYLVAQIEVGGNGDYTGADMRSAWFNRNIRIFSNILRMRGSADDRVLVLIGAGHVPILQHLVENAPELRLVDVLEVLDADSR
jgi:hypothetical protein